MRKFLERYGWRLHSSKKQGCFRINKWIDKKSGEVLPQWLAVQTQQERNKLDAIKRGKACSQSVAAVDSHDRSDSGDTIAAVVADVVILPNGQKINWGHGKEGPFGY